MVLLDHIDYLIRLQKLHLYHIYDSRHLYILPQNSKYHPHLHQKIAQEMYKIRSHLHRYMVQLSKLHSDHNLKIIHRRHHFHLNLQMVQLSKDHFHLNQRSFHLHHILRFGLNPQMAQKSINHFHPNL